MYVVEEQKKLQNIVAFNVLGCLIDKVYVFIKKKNTEIYLFILPVSYLYKYNNI